MRLFRKTAGLISRRSIVGYFPARSPWVVYAILSFCAASVRAENTDTAALREAFRDPPAAFRPLPITHSTSLNDAKLPDWLADRRAGGTVLDAGVNRRDSGAEQFVNPSYLNDPEVFQRLRSAAAELARRGNEVWIYDELAYPSGSAGGRVLEGHPDYQARALSCRDFYVTHDVFQIEVLHKTVQACLAMPREDGILQTDHALDLTDKCRPFLSRGISNTAGRAGE